MGWIVCLLWAATGATAAQDAFFKGGNAMHPAPDVYTEAYAKERARLDHEAAMAERARRESGAG